MLLAPVLVETGAGSTGATITGASSTGAGNTSGTVCYGISDMSIGHSGTVFRVLCPKISIGKEKLAPTGLHGVHVFATLLVG